MIVILLAIAAVVVFVPVACLVLVSIASLREDVAHSLGYQPAGPAQRAARRLLGFHGNGLGAPTGAARRAGKASFMADSSAGDADWAGSQDFIANNGRPADWNLSDQPDVPHLVS